MGCFSLEFLKELIIWAIVVIALYSCIKVLIPVLAEATKPWLARIVSIHPVGDRRDHHRLYHLRAAVMSAGDGRWLTSSSVARSIRSTPATAAPMSISIGPGVWSPLLLRCSGRW